MQLNPMALLQLRITGTCTVTLPEELFDMDGPGHYFRRIKTVSVTIPSVTGPYTSVNCTLTLTRNSIRKDPVVSGDGNDYARHVEDEDHRFSDYYGSLQAIVTSTAQNDSGMFETNLRDERYLPFENFGVVSEWQLELPKDLRQFDYNTISDVIMHMRYTAREGGGLLRQGAVKNLNNLIKEAQAPGSVRLFSIRHEFPTEWAKFQSQKPHAGSNQQRFELELNLREEHYPFWSQGRLKKVKHFDILARTTGAVTNLDIFDTVDGTAKENLTKDSNLDNLLVGKLSGVPGGIAMPDKPAGKVKLYFTDNTMMDLWFLVTWGNQ
ncbi:hypothetical protein [Bacillus sp. OV166]|uniref:Tc toxin subunit A-related protein n=1 Tax=Bacillus sp. OV166 TaxID=1882763 RepID=UPI00211B0A70|nr:hypothetical protein [Bacillus sp. OV166]